MLDFNISAFSESVEISMLLPPPFLLTNRTDYSRFLNTEALTNPIGYGLNVYPPNLYIEALNSM